MKAFLTSLKNVRSVANLRESFRTRHVKYGGYAALITLAVLIGLILLNLLMGQFAMAQIDLTWNQIFSLSEQTLQVLDQVDSPIQFYGLWRPGEENPQITDVINLYLARNRNISLEVLDPDRNPGFVMRYDRERRGISRGSLIVEGAQGFRVISPFEMYDFSQNRQGQSSITGIAVERRITSAILYAGTGITPMVYELTGQDQRTGLAGFGLFTLLERENYDLAQLNLMVSDIPDDASAIVLYAPQRDLAPMEVEKLLDYLDDGGRFFVAASFRTQDLTNLNTLLASYGIAFDYGIIEERDPNYSGFIGFSMVMRPDPIFHDITSPIMNKDQTPLVLAETMPVVELDTRRRSIEISPLMVTSPTAFLRRDVEDMTYERQLEDESGPFNIGVALMDPSWIDPNNPVPQTRIVAIGDANLLNMANMGFDANRDFFMNSLTWLQNRPETITVRSRSLFLLPMRLTMMQIIVFGGLFIAVIPLGFFISGLVVWLRRRHL